MSTLFIHMTTSHIYSAVMVEGDAQPVSISTIHAGININSDKLDGLLTRAEKYIINNPHRARMHLLSGQQERHLIERLAAGLELDQQDGVVQKYTVAARIEVAVGGRDTPDEDLGDLWRWSKTDITALKGPNAETAALLQDFYCLTSTAYPISADLFVSAVLYDCMKRAGVVPTRISLVCDEESHTVDFGRLVNLTRRAMPVEWGPDAPSLIHVTTTSMGATVAAFAAAMHGMLFRHGLTAVTIPVGSDSIVGLSQISAVC